MMSKTASESSSVYKDTQADLSPGDGAFTKVKNALRAALGARADVFAEDASYFSCGVYHGLFNLEAVTADPATGEEHRTSAAMAFVAAHLGWYRIFAGMEGIESTLAFRWGAFSKTEESFNGADFGIAIEVRPPKLEGIFYNVSFFQSKNDQNGRNAAANKPALLNVNQISSNYADYKGSADTKLISWVHKTSLDASRSEAEKFSRADANQNHQIFKLAMADAMLARLQTPHPTTPPASGSFAHYVIWPNQIKPSVVVSLESVRTHLKGRSTDLLSTKSGIKNPTLAFPKATSQFAKFLASGEIVGASGWALVSADAVTELIKTWPNLADSWMVGESKDHGPFSGLISQTVNLVIPETPKAGSKQGMSKKT